MAGTKETKEQKVDRLKLLNARKFRLLNDDDSNYGTIDILQDFKQLRNDDGTVSTVRTASWTDSEGRVYLVPTVWEGKNVSRDEQISTMSERNFGVFGSVKEADDYAERLHQFEAWKVDNLRKRSMNPFGFL